MTVMISRAALAAARAHAAATPGREACGLLLGVTGVDGGLRIDTAQPCANVAADPAIMFEIDPAALIAAHRAARNGGPAVIGCYHSHPSGPARPSARDAAMAAGDGQIWLILPGDDAGGGAGGEAGVPGAWRALPGGFAPVVLIPFD
ncbi:hypothetical protein GVO57_08280 [Sphingomonas changnyeongensis]|uniref:MPN domain-containing protein n=1 Tax=Sphingomonas changnyeongensis TaxID=2698679 RepID=A0A7Z2S8N3_9SPHN|nr:M67 family metallopeptidase [Sphingomonas changnyeongensis]QHL90822.1 hypothetical protein GVO57_08280 [Sphingomonas changnyeongensis]